MSSDFVRYAPEIESIDPYIDELLARVIAGWETRRVNRRPSDA
jgi:hypothetical protein